MRYILTKIGLFILTLWAAVTLNFILPRLMPGSPLDAALAKLAASGQQVTNAQRQAIEAQLGSPHGNIFSQYGQYLDDIVHLRFGQSFTDPDPHRRQLDRAGAAVDAGAGRRHDDPRVRRRHLARGLCRLAARQEGRHDGHL